MATRAEDYLESPGFTDLRKESVEGFIQESVDSGTLGSELFQGEFAIDDGLVAFDTSPVFTDYSQPNNPEVPEVETATTVKTIRGANYDVIYNNEKALGNIAFIPGTACAMSEAIAYIRYWSRKGTQQKQPVSQEPQNDTPTDAQKALQEEMNQKYFSSVDESFVSPGYGVEEVTGSETRVIAKVPDNTAYQSRPRQPVPTRVPVPASVSQPVSGKTYSANPSGALATTPFVIPSEAVWTFLFNPEELQLSSGPDFNRAETWGVSDPANSGQPLSWRSNKNRKLTFGKVLLHGYSFGKRVDSLERGLQELFTARDGENGADGPPVLEFVWGKRVFGPCVIQNVQVREKAWDNGLLVNAEVSFELEQVPEWTINDGFVDVLRPGRQSTVNDPLVPASTAEAGATPEGDNEKPKSGGKPPVVNQDLITKCQVSLNLSSQFTTLENEAKAVPNFTGAGFIEDRQKSAIRGMVAKYNQLYLSAVFWLKEEYKARVKITPRQLKNLVEDSIKYSESIADPYSEFKEAANIVLGVVNTSKVITTEVKNTKSCRTALSQASEKKKAAEALKKCQALQLGAPCKGRGPATTCSGIRLYCNGSTLQYAS